MLPRTMTIPSILALFPGQGSQKVGMGKDLLAVTPLATRLFEQADEVLGISLSKICFEGPAEELTKTAIAQPAILTVSTICFQMAEEKLGTLPIVAAAGHSLGEYSALVAAGAISFADAVALVHKRGKYMQEAVPVGRGKMVAVLGKEISEIEAAIAKIVSGVVEIANYNAPGQVVVAGDAGAVDAFVSQVGGKCLPLPVSAPFHCSLMKPAEDRLASDLKSLKISKPRFPVFANVSAEAKTDPEDIRDNLRRQVCGRVRWVECIERALKNSNAQRSVEFGSGNVLSGLMKRIQSELPRATADSIESLETLR
jgi:[acyl-carrier-protein] S-malonyltransferase